KQFLKGPVSAKITGNSGQANVELDLTKAVLRITPFNWEKGAGVAAKARFAIAQNGSAIAVSNLEISGRGLQAKGKAQINNGALVSAEITNVRLNPGDNFSLQLKNEGRSISAVLGGSQFDARAIMKQMLPGGQSRQAPANQALSVDGKVGRLVGFNDEIVSNATIAFRSGKGSALSLAGSFESGGSIDLSRNGGANGRLAVKTGNAGAALRFVDLYKRMTGGTLAADFSIGQEGAMAGPISISNFTVFGEPRLAQLVSEQAKGSTSLAEATQADLAGKQAKFELAQGSIQLDRGTIRLSNGIVRGANVGATAEGVVLSAKGQMDLRGTFMPARGLNRIVGAIPILGLLLGSGNKAGLIGITYQLAGDAKNPKVFVNPISMIAPGVFRQIFE
ncbi:MAG: AsmA-like C-terminal region-containing protein, partial [Notoacmeibacter sp.]